MILKALYDYYYNHQNLLPPLGMELNDISFLIIVDEEGNFIRLEDCRKENGKGTEYLVPRAVDRSSQILPNICWDNPEYVLGISRKDIKQENLTKNLRYISFKRQIDKLYLLYPENKGLRALHLFYTRDLNALLKRMKEDSLWDIFSSNLNSKISFRLQTRNIEESMYIIPENNDIQKYLEFSILTCNTGEKEQRCLVTGEYGPVVRTVCATPISSKERKAKLVSFQKESGYDSYGKIQCLNAPISRKAEFAFTTALNYFLRHDSKHKYVLNDRTYVFWSSLNSDIGEEIEKDFFYLLSFEDVDNNDINSEKVIKTFQSIFSGKSIIGQDYRFFILGLAPNKTREYIIFWKEIPIKEFAGNVLQHFKDMEIEDYRLIKKPYQGFYQMMVASSLDGNIDYLQPNLSENTIKSIFQGIPYPYTLYSLCLRRIRVEHVKNYTQKTDYYKEKDRMFIRVSIIKAYLNRLTNNKKKHTVMLDESNRNSGYLCGRLFATLEFIQQLIIGKDRIPSIRQRYLNAASTTPATVFATILNLSVHHEQQLEIGAIIKYRKIKEDIIDMFSSDGFPRFLDIQDQGRFFIGYHHQMAELYRGLKK